MPRSQPLASKGGHWKPFCISIVMPGFMPGIHVFDALKARRGWPRQAGRSAQINVTEPLRRIRRPHPSGDLRAPFAFDHRDIELAL
jgi:hypothetical protein